MHACVPCMHAMHVYILCMHAHYACILRMHAYHACISCIHTHECILCMHIVHIMHACIRMHETRANARRKPDEIAIPARHLPSRVPSSAPPPASSRGRHEGRAELGTVNSPRIPIDQRVSSGFMHACMYALLHKCICMHMYACMHAYMYACM